MKGERGNWEERESSPASFPRDLPREKPEKGLRVRDWKELSDAKVEAEMDGRFAGRDRAKNEKALGVRELLKWAAPVAKAQVARKGKREREMKRMDLRDGKEGVVKQGGMKWRRCVV